MFNKILVIAFAVIATIFMCENMAKAQFAVTEGLVSCWTFDRAHIDGDTAKDVWGENDGTIGGDPQVVEGKVGEAMEFDGVDDHVKTETSATLAITDAGTLEAWIKGTGGYEHIVGIYEWLTATQTIGMEIGQRDTGNAVADAFLGAWKVITPVYTINDGNWHHVVAVVSGTDLKFYIDGESRAEASGSDEMNMGAGAHAVMGMHLGEELHYVGVIDEVRVYNIALSVDEVNQNMEAEGLELAVMSDMGKLALTWGEIKVSR